MKKIILFAIIVSIILAFMENDKENFSDESLSAKLTTEQNSEIQFKDILKKHHGKATVIEVWASWCGDCVKAMPKIKELQVNNPEVDYIFISMDKSADKWKEGIKKHELKGEHYWVNDPEMMKGEFGKSINLNWIPRYIILDKTGKISIYKAIETDFDKINQTLKTLK